MDHIPLPYRTSIFPTPSPRGAAASSHAIYIPLFSISFFSFFTFGYGCGTERETRDERRGMMEIRANVILCTLEICGGLLRKPSYNSPARGWNAS
jgi:hypothetical protein